MSSVLRLPIGVQGDGVGISDAAAFRAALGAGTAAVEDVGVAIGDVVQLVDVGGGTPGMPTIDGSQITGVGGAYTPAVTADWGSDNPADAADALDRLAATFNAGPADATGIPVAGAECIIIPEFSGAGLHGGRPLGLTDLSAAGGHHGVAAAVTSAARYHGRAGGTAGHLEFVAARSDTYPLTSLNKLASYTIFAVLMSDLATSHYALGGAAAGAPTVQSWGYIRFNAGNVYSAHSNAGGGSSYNTNTGPITAGKWHLVTLKYATGNDYADIYVDDSAALALTKTATTATTNADVSPTFGLGRAGAYVTEPWTGRIGPVVIYPSALSDGDRTSVRDWLQALMGL